MSEEDYIFIIFKLIRKGQSAHLFEFVPRKVYIARVEWLI
jgi:hypothetical protein